EWKGERERDLDGLAVAERKRRAEVGLVGGSAGGDGEAAGRRLEMERRGRQVERRKGRRELLVDGAGRKARGKGAQEICVGERPAVSSRREADDRVADRGGGRSGEGGVRILEAHRAVAAQARADLREDSLVEPRDDPRDERVVGSRLV